MTQPGDRRPPGLATPPPRHQREDAWRERLRPRSRARAIVVAIGVTFVAGTGWALLRGILELSIGLLALSAVGGWAIGAVLRQVRAPVLLAGGLGILAWLLGLFLTWVVTRIILPSDLGLPERFETISFLSFSQQQFGLIEVGGLVLYVVTAAYAARPSGTSG